MKAAGALMVILSCSAFGLNMAHSLRRRAEFLHSLVRALTLMRNELCASLLPVREVLALLARDTNGSAGEFFAHCLSGFEDKDFRTAWTYAALGGRAWGMDEEECRTLAGLGDVIGRYEAEKQRELIDRAAEYFDCRAKLADEEKRRQYKLRAALGVGSGLMLAILMI